MGKKMRPLVIPGDGTLNTTKEPASLELNEYQDTQNFEFRDGQAKRRQGSSLVYDYALEGAITHIGQQQFRDDASSSIVIGQLVDGATVIETVGDDHLVMQLALSSGNQGLNKGYHSDPSVITQKQSQSAFGFPIRMDRSSNGDLFAGISGTSGGYYSSDHGETWTAVSSSNAINNAMRVPNSDLFVAAATNVGPGWGVAKSVGPNDFSTNVLTVGYSTLIVRAFRSDLIIALWQNPSTVTMRCDRSLSSPYTSWEGDVEVVATSSGPQEAIQLKNYSAAYDRIVVVGNANSGGSAFYSDDDGATWNQGSGVTSLLYDVVEDGAGNLYAVGTNTSTDCVWKSTDGGATWTAINSDITTPITDPDFCSITITRGGTLYALNGGATNACHLWKSTDDGVTWTAQNSTSYGTNAAGQDRRHSLHVA